MRKPLSILIVLALTAALFAGCGKGGNESSQNEESSSSVSSSETSSEESSSEESSEESDASEEASSEEFSETESETTELSEDTAQESSSSSSKPASSSSSPSSKPTSSASSSTSSSKPAESSSSSSSQPASSESSESSASSETSSSSESSEAATGVSAQDIYSAIDAAFQNKYGHGPIANAPFAIDDVTLSEKFHISTDQVVSYSGVVAGMMTNCDELLVVQAKDGEIDNVKAALQQALSEQKDAFSWYGVMYNTERLDAAKVIVSGNYAALLIVGVSPENEETSVDFSSDVSMAENAFYGAIG
ncbi:MAG TPA: DUF4358 domain-containing protein [Candidatus Faecivivens stercorigallinarum]|nr:DUF4358 domain-containing protein [Candidatus Faecivivens stercorigallinarum]